MLVFEFAWVNLVMLDKLACRFCLSVLLVWFNYIVVFLLWFDYMVVLLLWFTYMVVLLLWFNYMVESFTEFRCLITFI